MIEREIGYCSSLTGVRAQRLFEELRFTAAMHGIDLREQRWCRDKVFDEKLHIDCAPNPGGEDWKRKWAQVCRRPYRVYGREGTSAELQALANVAMGLLQLSDLNPRRRPKKTRHRRPKKREKRAAKK